jgi:hypothetical protein
MKTYSFINWLLFFSFPLSSLAQNVGIGTNTPDFKLDVNGRMRIRHTAGFTAGLWLDGPTLTTRSFIGSVDDNHVGIYGNGGAGWKMVMNVENGNVGLGTTAPTAGLDLNGTLRIRSSFPKKGSILTSEDGSGNASWADPIAFRASSLVDGANLSVAKATWTKVYFNATANYNLGLLYQILNSQFYAGEAGIYAFHTLLTYADDYFAMDAAVRLRLNRNGVISTLAQKQFGSNRDFTTNANPRPSLIQDLYAEVQLQVGDYVWVETYAGDDIYNNSNSVNSAPLLANSTLTYFTGRLVARF